MDTFIVAFETVLPLFLVIYRFNTNWKPNFLPALWYWEPCCPFLLFRFGLRLWGEIIQRQIIELSDKNKLIPTFGSQIFSFCYFEISAYSLQNKFKRFVFEAKQSFHPVNLFFVHIQ